jgi:hypothetical protein
MSNPSSPTVRELAELPSVPWSLLAASAYRVKLRLSGDEGIPFEQLPESERANWELLIRHISVAIAGQVTYAMNPSLLIELESSWSKEQK